MNVKKCSAPASLGVPSGTDRYQPPQRKLQKAQEQAAVEGPSERESFSELLVMLLVLIVHVLTALYTCLNPF